MNRVDLHPEELLDAQRRGEAPEPEQRARLEDHLAACDACAFERAVARDFAAELERSEPADRDAAARAAAGALEDPRVAAGTVRRSPAGFGTTTRRFRLLLVAAVLLAATVGAAAAAWYALVVIARGSAAEEQPAPTCPPGQTGLAGSTVYAIPDAALPTPRAASPAVAPPGPAPPPPAVPNPVPPSGPTAGRHPEGPVPATPDAGSAALETAETLFSRANAARRARDYGTAARLYDDLALRFSGSREEMLSRVTFGSLLLDVLGQPQRALNLFDSYLAAARGGTMAEEALVGRAVALGRLGRAAEERATWHALLAEFPESANAERARRRLAELP